MLTNQELSNRTIATEQFSAVPEEKASATERGPTRMKQPLIELFYSLLIGAGAFIVSYGFGYWLFADPNPEIGRIGGLIIAPVMGILFFGFAWGYFGQRHKWPNR